MEEFDFTVFEQLFKNEKLTKSRRTVGMLLRFAEIIKDPNAHPDAKKQALDNIKLMNAGFEPKLIRAPKPPKEPGQEKPKKAKMGSKEAFQAALQPKTLEYHPDLEMHGVTQQMWNQSPKEHHKIFMNYHNDVMGGKYPEEHAKLVTAGKIKAPATPAAAAPTTPVEPVKKSLKKLKSLIKALKEHYPQSN